MIHNQNTETEKWIERLNHVNRKKLYEIEHKLIEKRINWFYENPALIDVLKGNDLEKAYQMGAAPGIGIQVLKFPNTDDETSFLQFLSALEHPPH